MNKTRASQSAPRLEVPKSSTGAGSPGAGPIPESESWLRAILSSAPIILWAIDKDGAFTLSEGLGLAALGLKPGEVVGRSVFEVYRDQPDILAHHRRALAGEALTSVGEVGGVALAVQYAPVRDSSGQVTGVIGVGTDITEQRRMEEALRQSNQFTDEIIQSAGVGTVVHDLDLRYGSTPSWRR
jgi:PAS domain S-box-containing protein